MRGVWDYRASLFWGLAAALAVLFAWLDYAGYLGQVDPSVPITVPESPANEPLQIAPGLDPHADVDWVEFEAVDE